MRCTALPENTGWLALAEQGFQAFSRRDLVATVREVLGQTDRGRRAPRA
jgi:hypothetical protein